MKKETFSSVNAALVYIMRTTTAQTKSVKLYRECGVWYVEVVS